MSIKLMSMVFDRYPNGGGEMLLALALADHAQDDGSSVRPGIKSLAAKTRQSERTVQYQLRRMEDAGWLILVNSGNGGRNQRREYQVNPDWIKGANIAPAETAPIAKGATDDIKGATDDSKGCNPQQERVQPAAPAYNHQGTIKEPSENHQPKSNPAPPSAAKKFDALTALIENGVEEQTAQDWLAHRKAKRAAVTRTVLQNHIREAGIASMTLQDALIAACSRGWVGFEAKFVQDRQSYPGPERRSKPRPSMNDISTRDDDDAVFNQLARSL